MFKLSFKTKNKNSLNLIKRFIYKHIVLNRLNLGTNIKELHHSNNFFLEFIRYNYAYFNLNKIIFYLKRSLLYIEDISFLGFNVGLSNGIFFNLIDHNIRFYKKKTLVNLFMFLKREGLIIYGNEFFYGALLNHYSLNFRNKRKNKFVSYSKWKERLYILSNKYKTIDEIYETNNRNNLLYKLFGSYNKEHKNKKIKDIFFPKSFIILNKDFFLLNQCSNLGLLSVYLNDSDDPILIQNYFFPGNTKSFLAKRFTSFLFVQSFLLGKLKRYINLHNVINEAIMEEIYDFDFRAARIRYYEADRKKLIPKQPYKFRG